MSSRNFRKICGNSLPPPDSDDSDGDFEPIANRNTQKSTYEGLVLSSESDSEREPEADDEEEGQEAAASSVAHGGARKKKPQKKGKGKGKKTKAAGDTGASTSTASTSGASGSGRRARRLDVGVHGEELDEIDKSVLEVNALLGEPPPAPALAEPAAPDEGAILLEVKPKFLNVANELRRLFGPEDPEEVRQRIKTQPHRLRLLKRVMVGPTHDTAIYDFKKMGMSMSIEKREGNIVHFVYDHDLDHQKMHHAFLVKYAKNHMSQGTALLNMDDARRNMHVEPLLEIADTLFRMDENGLANEIVENVVTYLQYIAHPSFNLSSMNVRLSYNYLENRPFHVAMLKYMYLLTNKACHRTALEIAKMLINVDPVDPLAVLFVIDTLAIRAREHQWLIDAIEYFNKQRQAKMLFNIQYSFALAHFHVAMKAKKDLSEADEHLQNAIMSYPRVVYRILEYASVNEPSIQTHSVYTNEPQALSGEGLSELMLIYAKLTWSRWREPQVMEWFIRNAKKVIKKYDESLDVRERVRELAMLRHNIFQVWPTEIMRHISIIRSMSNLLLETTLTLTPRATSSWDPLFDPGVNRYSYRTPGDAPRALPAGAAGGRALLYSYANWNEHSLFMAHLIGTRGRTQHSSAFDPWHDMLGVLVPGARIIAVRVAPARPPAAAATALALPPPPPSPRSPESTLTDNDTTTTSSDRPVEAAVQPYQGNMRLHQLEAMFNPYRLNGIIPDRLFHPTVSAYAINFLNMFHDLLLQSVANAALNHLSDSESSLDESDMEDLLFNAPAQEEIPAVQNHQMNGHVDGTADDVEDEPHDGLADAQLDGPVLEPVDMHVYDQLNDNQANVNVDDDDDGHSSESID